MGETLVPRKILPTEIYLVPLRESPCSCSSNNVTTKQSQLKKVEIVIPSVKELTSEKMIDVECPFEGCTKVFANLPALQMHFTKGHSTCQEDSEIKKKFSEELGLSLTVEYKKRECEQLFFCPIESCERSQTHGNYFTRKSFVKYHFLRQHMERKFKCEVCQTGFALLYDLEKHQKICGRVYPCSCGAIYRSRQALVTHSKRRQHTFPEITVFKANSLGLKNYMKQQGELQAIEASIVSETSSSPSFLVLEDDVRSKRTKYVPRPIHEADISRSIPELDLSLDYVHTTVNESTPEKKRCAVLNETERPSSSISTSFSSTTMGSQIGRSVFNSVVSSNQSKETQFQDLICFEPSASTVLPNYHDSMEHKCAFPEASHGNQRNSLSDSKAELCKKGQYQTMQPIQVATNISNSSPKMDCKVVDACQNDFAFQFVSDVKETNRLCRGEPVKTPIYYINYGETQTDMLPQHAVQGTQTTSEFVLAVKSGTENPIKTKERCYSRNKRKSAAISASIQTECSINSKGQRNRSIKERTTSAVQTIKIVPQKTFATIGTQTDIARKRAVNKKRRYQEVEVQTANPTVSHQNVYLQTSFSPQTSQNFDSQETLDAHCVVDAPKSSCLDLPQNPTMQTETQTMPFNLDDFFDCSKSTCNNSASINSPTFSDFGSFINLDTPVYNADVPAETQTNWGDLLAEVDSPFDPLSEREFSWRENLSESNQTSLFETCNSNSYNFSVLDL